MAKSLTVSPALLRPNPWNTNYVSPENEAKLGTSIKELGLFKPIVVREKPDTPTNTLYEILGGQHRWQEVVEAGGTEIDIYNLGPIDDTLAKKISLADNARYGADDTLALGKLLGEIGSAESIQQFLPFTESDVNAIFSASDIALDDLELPEGLDEKPAEAAPEREAKTHTIMRFKVALGDAETITEMIAKTIKHQGFTSSDELTNAGDALVHLLIEDED